MKGNHVIRVHRDPIIRSLFAKYPYLNCEARWYRVNLSTTRHKFVERFMIDNNILLWHQVNLPIPGLKQTILAKLFICGGSRTDKYKDSCDVWDKYHHPRVYALYKQNHSRIGWRFEQVELEHCQTWHQFTSFTSLVSMCIVTHSQWLQRMEQIYSRIPTPSRAEMISSAVKVF